MPSKIEILSQVISEVTHPTESEAALQESMHNVLKDLGFQREFILDKANRLDFFNENHGLAIEVKIKGTAMALSRQVARYSEFDKIKEILVVTTKPSLCSALPETFSGKPIWSLVLYTSIL